MRDNPLLVPIELDVLLLGKEGVEKPLCDFAPHYEWLGDDNLLGEDIVNEGLNMQSGLPGAHLHWIMPDALLHGKQDEEGNLSFPALPNRWIVMRLSAGEYYVNRKIWLVQSDKITFEGEEDTTEGGMRKTAIPYLVYDETDGIWKPAGKNGTAYAYLGDAAIYGKEKTPDTKLEYLTAMGIGDHLFTALYPLCKTVFGFYDPLEGETEGLFTYLVCGYYSDEKTDPFFSRTEEEITRDFLWKWEAKKQPDSVLCHGAVYNVDWKGGDIRYCNTNTEQPELAFANTSSEALAALFQKKLPEVSGLERILNALQCGILEEFNNKEQQDRLITMENKLHERQFCEFRAGESYQLRRLETKADSGALRLSSLEYDMVKEIQEMSEQLNYTHNLREAYSEEVFLLWHRYMKNVTSPFAAGDTHSIREKLEKLVKYCEELRDDESVYRMALEKKVKTANEILIKQGIEMSPIPENSFFEPNPPVLLMSDKNKRRTYKQGFQKAKDGMLPCRTQPVSCLTVEVENYSIMISAEELMLLCDPPEKPLPEILNKICMETILMGEAFVPILIKIGLEKIGISEKERYLEEIATEVKQQQKRLEERMFPAAYKSWAQPWNPLVLDWQVGICPARTSVSRDNSFQCFKLGDIDFEPNILKFNKEEIPVGGRVLLTPHAPFVMNKMLERLAEQFGEESVEYQEMIRFSEELQEKQILSQQLAGFNEALRGLKWVPGIPILPYTDEKKERELAARIQKVMEDMYPVSEVGSSLDRYLPIRAGKLKLKKLIFIDEFGQYRNLELSDSLIVGECFRCEEDNTALLPPRFPGKMRICFQWISAGELGGKALDTASSPICGFVIGNILERSLQIYNQSGIFLGWLQQTEDGVRWRHAPGLDMVLENIPGKQLSLFVKSMLSWNCDRFSKLLTWIDRFFAEKPALGGENGVSCFGGGCLALARAELSVEEKGLPKYFWGAEEISTNGYEEAEFSVKLGDCRLEQDGVVGWFAGKNGEENYADFYFCEDEMPLTLMDAKRTTTLLLDPYRCVTIRTGFLPVYQIQLVAELYQSQMEGMKLFLNMWPVLAQKEEGSFPITQIGRNPLQAIQVKKKGEVISYSLDKEIPEMPAQRPVIRELYLSVEKKGGQKVQNEE